MVFALLAAPIASLLIAGDPAQEQAVRVARRRLAEELHVDERRLIVQEVSSVEWPDASLGCPQKGMMYAQVVTPGYRVVLGSGGRRYEVHVAGDRAVRCEASAGESKIVDDSVVHAARMQGLAREHLARRLRLRRSAVKVTAMRPATWPDAGLGCSKDKAGGPPVPRPGFAIELQAKGRAYRYHADYSRVVPCDGM
jgi:hypothetical protein